MSKHHKIILKCKLRSYVYVAHLTPKTGKLKKITAGCREWECFADAIAHYKGRTSAGEKWGTHVIVRNLRYALDAKWPLDAIVYLLPAYRTDARKTLTLLEAAVLRYRAERADAKKRSQITKRVKR